MPINALTISDLSQDALVGVRSNLKAGHEAVYNRRVGIERELFELSNAGQTQTEEFRQKVAKHREVREVQLEIEEDLETVARETRIRQRSYRWDWKSPIQ